jgi:hypothetical protein
MHAVQKAQGSFEHKILIHSSLFTFKYIIKLNAMKENALSNKLTRISNQLINGMKNA